MTRWTWDPVKAEANVRKHGLTFELAAQVLADPSLAKFPDPHTDNDRWRAIGRTTPGAELMVFVVYTDPIDIDGVPVGRIISARRANKKERRRYEGMGR